MSDLLSKPLSLPNGASLPNRFAKAAMTEGLADGLNRPTARLERLYRRWGAGGAGLLITGNVMVDRRYLERPGNVAIDGPQTDEQLERLRGWSGAAREGGADIWMQLSHPGRQTPKIVARQPVAPSAVALGLPGGQFGEPRALLAEEAPTIIERFAHAASIAKHTGFTGVQIHAAHGYLISEFLNPLVNQREDMWGGSLENRARFLLETVDAVRAQTGTGFPVSVKLNSSDFQKGGFAPGEAIQVARWLEKRGVDLIEISGGSYEQPAMMDLDGIEARHEEEKRDSTKAREAYFLDYADEMRASLKTPLMVTGGFRSRAAMEEALASGACDVVGVARPLCVDPDTPQKLMDGSLDGLDAYEKRLRLGPGIFGPGSRLDIMRALNGFAAMAFFYQNLYRLADGKAGREEMPLLPAFIAYQRGERAAARRLDRRRRASSSGSI